MKVQSLYRALILMFSVVACRGEESEHSVLTELLESMLSHEQEHKQVEEETGVQVRHESAFLNANKSPKGNSNSNSNNIIPLQFTEEDLLIADSRDADDAPLPLGWEHIGNLLNEPIRSSHSAHDEFPLWKMMLGCLIAVIGVSCIFLGSGMLCLPVKKEEEHEHLPTHYVERQGCCPSGDWTLSSR